MPPIEPFLRWAGGKTWLIPHLPNLLKPIQFEHYHEPFLGGGAIFFALDLKKKSYLSDANPELINTYIQIRDNPDQVAHFFTQFQNTKNEYYRIRDQLVPQSPEEMAARFLFLNQTSFNGLFRVNRNGTYNVPYGFRQNWKYDIARLSSASQKLQKTRIEFGDFEINKYRIKRHDLVFLDPPYTVSHNNNGFIEYNQNLFSIEDQHRLNCFIDYIKRKDAYYILTNAAHQAILEIFDKDEDRTIELTRQSLIGGKKAKRMKISEYIFTNIPEA